MTRPIFTLLLFFFFLPTLPSSTPNTTIHETLTHFGLPPGLFPDSVTSYTLDSDTGRFTVDLPKPCYIHFDYLVYYEKRVMGILKLGSITNLEGVEVRKLLIWFAVDEIRVDLPPSDSIYFHVGFFNRKLDVAQFETVRSCEEDRAGVCEVLEKWLPGLLLIPEKIQAHRKPRIKSSLGNQYHLLFLLREQPHHRRSPPPVLDQVSGRCEGDSRGCSGDY